MTRLFGTDGVRGIAGQWPLTPEFVQRLGFWTGRVLSRGSGRGRSIFVVRDTRGSGPSLQASLSQGLRAAGFNVLDGGVLPTPSVAVLVPRKRFAAGAVISASHNPAEFNGIKFFGPSGAKLSDALEREIEQACLSNEPLSMKPAATRPFSRASQDYLRYLRSTWPAGVSLRGFPIAVDCAHGATSPIAAQLFRSLGADVHVLSARPDGTNINRGCGALHPESLALAVRRRRARLGVAFDGDGDRAIFVDEQGTVRDGDAVLLAAARYLKSVGRLKKNLVVVTVMSNLGLIRALEALDIRTMETPVGDKYVGAALEKTGAVLGGEPSGHVIFREFLPTGDGLLTALQVLGLLRLSGQPFSALTSLAVRYPQVLVNVPVEEKKPLDTLPRLRGGIQAVEKALGKTGRILVRYSGTEPLLRIMIEGPELPRINQYAQSLAALARQLKI